MAPQYRSFLDTNELRTLEGENAKDKKVRVGVKHEEKDQGEGRCLNGENEYGVDPGLP